MSSSPFPAVGPSGRPETSFQPPCTRPTPLALEIGFDLSSVMSALSQWVLVRPRSQKILNESCRWPFQAPPPQSHLRPSPRRSPCGSRRPARCPCPAEKLPTSPRRTGHFQRFRLLRLGLGLSHKQNPPITTLFSSAVARAFA